MEKRITIYRLCYETLEDKTRRAWFLARGVMYSTVRSIQDAYPDDQIVEDLKTIVVDHQEVPR